MGKLTLGDWGGILAASCTVIGAMGTGIAAVGGVAGTIMQKADKTYEQRKIYQQRQELMSETRNIMAPAIRSEVQAQLRAYGLSDRFE